MSEHGNDEGARPAPADPPAYGTPPSYGTPPPSYGTPPAYGSPPDPGTTEFGSVPPTAAYPPPNYPPQNHPGQAYPGQWPAYPEPSQAVLALILGIVGLFVFWPVAPFAWVIGRNEVRAVDAGRRDPSNRGAALAGQVMGIIGTVLLVLGAVLIVVAIVVLASVGTSTTVSG